MHGGLAGLQATAARDVTAASTSLLQVTCTPHLHVQYLDVWMLLHAPRVQLRFRKRVCHRGAMPAKTSQQGPYLCGLTGSIGMGKSTVSSMLKSHGVPMFCADEVVHKLYSPAGAAVALVGQVFPNAVIDGAVDRAALSKYVIGNEAAMKQLEGIVHPLVEAERLKFLRQAAMDGIPLVVFDIPLLYETGAGAGLDAVVVVSAPAEQQQKRVLARPNMTAEKLQAILARQVPDAEKRQQADFVIDTGCSLHETEEQVVKLIEELKGRTSTNAAQLLRTKQAD
eukprot:GHRR01001977.1.p1 GENE.GHRR01001977.1~~GHRR01001977.1.p1  ORF type:complete len:282 (+),score=68.37 GHRR01001977.1:23-868(+)